MRFFLLILGFLCASIVSAADNPGATPTETDKPSQIDAKTNEPVSVVKEFLIALVSNDEVTIRKLILPHADASVLWHGQKAPDQAIDLIKKDLENAKCRELKVGDVFILPNKKELKITEKMVNKDNKMLVPTLGGTEMPTPIPVQRIKGQWKVDASSLIAARLAAQKAMEKARQNQ